MAKVALLVSWILGPFPQAEGASSVSGGSSTVNILSGGVGPPRHTILAGQETLYHATITAGHACERLSGRALSATRLNRSRREGVHLEPPYASEPHRYGRMNFDSARSFDEEETSRGPLLGSRTHGEEQVKPSTFSG